MMQLTESLGYCFRMPAGMLNVVTNRLAILSEIDHDILADDPVIHGRFKPQFDIEAVGSDIVVESLDHRRIPVSAVARSVRPSTALPLDAGSRSG